MRKTCKRCGVRFETSNKTRRYCGMECYRKQQKEKPNKGTFQVGIVPWNTGTKGVMQVNAGSFKKGLEPANKLPVGSKTIRVDKTGNPRAHIKVTENGTPYDWQLRAVIVWERYNGLVPKGMLVHHRDRDTLNDAILNLELMDRAGHLSEHRPEFEDKRRRTVAEGFHAKNHDK